MTIQDVSDYRLDPPYCRADSDGDDCGCQECHELREHDWRDWAVYPECEHCEADMFAWLRENTDYFELQRQYGRAA